MSVPRRTELVRTMWKGSPPAPTPAQSAHYTYEMLVSLRKLAAVHKQVQLAHLIEDAAAEAQALSKQAPDSQA